MSGRGTLYSPPSAVTVGHFLNIQLATPPIKHAVSEINTIGEEVVRNLYLPTLSQQSPGTFSRLRSEVFTIKPLENEQYNQRKLPGVPSEQGALPLTSEKIATRVESVSSPEIKIQNKEQANHQTN